MEVLDTNQQIMTQLLGADANSKKVGFFWAMVAQVNLSFSIPYPESIFKQSSMLLCAAHGVIAFTPAFLLAETFDRDIEHGVKAEEVRG